MGVFCAGRHVGPIHILLRRVAHSCAKLQNFLELLQYGLRLGYEKFRNEAGVGSVADGLTRAAGTGIQMEKGG